MSQSSLLLLALWAAASITAIREAAEPPLLAWESCQEEPGTAVSSTNAKQWINYTPCLFIWSSWGSPPLPAPHMWSQQKTTGVRCWGLLHPLATAGTLGVFHHITYFQSSVQGCEPAQPPRDAESFFFFSVSFSSSLGDFMLSGLLIFPTALGELGWEAGERRFLSRRASGTG